MERAASVREECAEDARGSMVRLTGAGRVAIEGAAPGHVAATRRYLFDLLSADEEVTLSAPSSTASSTTSSPVAARTRHPGGRDRRRGEDSLIAAGRAGAPRGRMV